MIGCRDAAYFQDKRVSENDYVSQLLSNSDCVYENCHSEPLSLSTVG